MTPSGNPPATNSRKSDSRRGVVLAGALGVVLVVLAMVALNRPPPPAEVLRSDLKPRDGRLYLTSDESVPFTGNMIERYDSGALKSRSAISNGVLHGVSEGWHTNGQMQVREHFKEGISHGLRVKWHENGAKMSEATVVDGKLQGVFRRWHDNGKLAEEMELKHDHPEGLARSFYPSGSPKAQAVLKDGQVTEQKYWKDGERNEVTATEPPNRPQ